jgi:hypothetical protein
LPAIAVYCSPTCRREAGRIQSRIAARARRSPHRFSCLVCGVEGWTTRRRRLCCSFRCTRIYQRIREDMGWTGPDPLPHDFVKAKRAYGLAVWFLSDRRAFLASHPDPLDPLRALGAVPPNRQISP